MALNTNTSKITISDVDFDLITTSKVTISDVDFDPVFWYHILPSFTSLCKNLNILAFVVDFMNRICDLWIFE
jgi:hypothetical protein